MAMNDWCDEYLPSKTKNVFQPTNGVIIVLLKSCSRDYKDIYKAMLF